MKIALVGVPGSGKTKLAKAIRGKCESATPVIYDNNAQKFSKATGKAIGHLADYRINLMLACERTKALWASPKDAIFTQTILDSLAYLVLQTSDAVDLTSEANLRELTLLYASYSLAFMVRDSFDFDEVLYLPWNGKYDLPENTYRDLDRTYVALFEEFKITPTEVKDVRSYSASA